MGSLGLDSGIQGAVHIQDSWKHSRVFGRLEIGMGRNLTWAFLVQRA